MNPRKGGNTPRSVAALPQIHGRAREAVQVATTATGVELNAVSAGVSAKAVRVPGSAAVANSAASLLVRQPPGCRSVPPRFVLA